jgi:Tol biopolymer transport system component
VRRALAISLGLACCLGGAPELAAASFPGINGRIAFVRPGQGIWSVNPDGSARLRVSPDSARTAGCDTDPSFAPSGLELAFQTCDPDRHVTVVGTMTATGLDRHRLVSSSDSLPSPQTPAFSSDGKRVAFAAGASAATRLFAIGTDGSGRRRLGVIGYSPSWSPTGRLAYAVPLNQRRWCNSTQLDDVYALDSSLRHERRLTRTYGSYAPDWSPNGRRIAYTRDFTVTSGDAKHVRRTPMDCKPVVRRASGYGPEIVVARASGKHARRLTRKGGSDPVWSPDGKLIAFERSGWIWTMRPDGHGAQKLVRGKQPAWQPLAATPTPRGND